MSKKGKDFWCSFQSSLGYELPPCVLKLLIECGYDNEISIAQLTADNLIDIEAYVHENLRNMFNDMTCYYVESYRKQQRFRFLPAHRVTILSLPGHIEKFKSASVSKPTEFSYVLKNLIETAENNSHKDSNHHRYNEIIRYFSTYIYMMCGKSCYETLSTNLPLPQASTILRYIGDNKQSAVEGELRCKQLSEYLQKLNVEKKVWLSEDASGIISKVEYDTATNQLVGLVLPINTNGMPISFTFIARNAEDIQKYIKKPLSTLVYIVMAQPLKENVPPFLLQLFGTDNKFNTQNVLQRWKHTKRELEKYGIEVAGISSDGDTRLLSSMRAKIQFNPQFGKQSTEKDDISCVQDTIHVGTKLRNRFLKPSILLPIGNKLVSVSHLKLLINNVSKDIHGLVMKDVCPDDRQNYGSLQKVMDSRVLDALSNNIPDSEATIMYLRICQQITSSFNEYNLPPLDRVYRIWHSVFFLRLWRKWILAMADDKEEKMPYKLIHNFITQNAYACIEINAHSLIDLISKFRNERRPELFLPALFNSQTCEKIFRQIRSMTTINWTKINYTLLELLHSIGRIELQNDIIYSKLAGVDVKFPRIESKKEKIIFYELPTQQEIDNVIKTAKENAVIDASRFNIHVDINDIERCELPDIIEAITEEINCVDEYDFRGSDCDEDDVFSSKVLPDNLNLRDYCLDDVFEKSAFTNIMDKSGEQKTVRKSSILWLLTTSKESLSSDRLKRVQGPSKVKSSRQLQLRKPNSSTKKNEIFYKSDEIQIGQWCFFRCGDDIVIGAVVGFKYVKGKSEKEKQYSWDFAPVLPNKNTSELRGVEVLGSWHRINEDGVLNPLDNKNCFYINIKHYAASMVAPLFKPQTATENGSICVSQDYLKNIQAELFKLRRSGR